MADVEMPDAGASGEGKAKAPVKPSKSTVAEGGENKKRFEVKKVGPAARSQSCVDAMNDSFSVERRRALGLGHCR